MQFYKICGELIEKERAVENDWASRRGAAHRIASRTESFNMASETRYCFLAELGDEYVTLGAIVTQSMDVAALARAFVKHIDLDVQLEEPEEITLGNIQSLLGSANRQSYITDDDNVLEQFRLDRLIGRRGRGLEFGENLICPNAKLEDLEARARMVFASKTLSPELERIYAGGRSAYTAGHPVHYVVQTDNHDTRRAIHKILLEALHANHRLQNYRYSFLDFHPGESYPTSAYEMLYKVSDGGAVIVRYRNSADDEEDDDCASSSRNMVEHLCEMAKRYRNSVLTVFCFPLECKKILKEFYESLGNMTFVEIKEDHADSAAAREFLTALAKKNRVRTDKKLFARIMDDQLYLADELQSMFDEWYDLKLRSSVFPQYKGLCSVTKEVVKAEPRGTAYDELSEMIGLSEAKQVIQKALNYYKMQKLYEEKGVKRSNPAMHMIFSGNPGTAKTTVARLFARIMRENGLLSRGHLVEVGRADLVGKYVGWTAPTIQAKFKEAKGGVLFIDEAYSLVDDRNGSFGDEAINTIVQEMENHREELVVIFAGYPDKMEGFLQKNPGLRSRIAFHVPFADYNNDELCRIADMICKKNGMKIASDAFGKLAKAFDAARERDDFGNGRYVRNLFEQAKMNQASRILEKEFEDITTDDITTITADDIVIPQVAEKVCKKQIGFY